MSRDVSAIIENLLVVALGRERILHPEAVKLLMEELEESLESLVCNVLRDFFLEMFETDKR